MQSEYVFSFKGKQNFSCLINLTPVKMRSYYGQIKKKPNTVVCIIVLFHPTGPTLCVFLHVCLVISNPLHLRAPAFQRPRGNAVSLCGCQPFPQRSMVMGLPFLQVLFFFYFLDFCLVYSFYIL